ncbi:MAG: Hpt domain-containing protein [Gammaproteobacteria bacterium]|nr:Hpt domain-containing protein [Gammaproteobacteria bacterium]
MTDAPETGRHIQQDFDLRALHDTVGDDPAVLGEIIGCFDTVATGMRAGLLRAAADRDAGAAALLAHSLKSSSRAVGALPLGSLCERLEARAAGGRRDGFAPLVADVVEAMDAALAAMRRWRGTMAAAAGRTARQGL